MNNDKKEKIILAGGSGFLGGHLAVHYRNRGHEVLVFTRHPHDRIPGVREVAWDGHTVGEWKRELEGAGILVNLTGRNVNCRHTAANRKEIMDSRVDSVRVLGRALDGLRTRPPVWLQASSLAIYGDTGDRICGENAPDGPDFPALVCRRWEDAFARELPTDMRGVILRIGFVLARDGGALVTLEKLTRWFLGGTIGHGRQWISWIHLADAIRVIDFLAREQTATGAFNITGPQPATNREFMRRMRQVLKRPWAPPAPRPALHIGAWAMRTEASLALQGRRCEPRRLTAAGFRFDLPSLTDALDELYQTKGENK